MGTTTVEFRGRRFEGNDGALEVWLHLLVDEINTLYPCPEWLQIAKDEWHLQSTAAFGFGVVPGLDRYIISDEQRNLLLSLSQRVLYRLQQHAENFSADELNAMNLGSFFMRDVTSEFFLGVGDSFIDLLE